MPMFRVMIGPALVAALLASGCAKKPPEEVDVAGRVEDAGGKPVAHVLVRFHPQDVDPSYAKVLTRVTKSDGTFTGTCFPGRYKVTMVPIPAGSGGSDPGAGALATPDKGPTSMPSRYTSPTETPWEETIPDSGKKDIVLKVR
jgi:hypothetical protein